MKKVLAAVLVLCVVCAAGSAIAQPQERRNIQQGRYGFDRNDDFRDIPNFQGRGPNPNGMKWQPSPFNHKPGDFKGKGFEGCKCRGPVFTPDMPKEIREKSADLAKLRIDLEEALSSRPVNREKALDVYAKIQALENEIDTWRFTKRLDMIETFRKHHELNRKVKPLNPETKTPAPETETIETPESSEK